MKKITFAIFLIAWIPSPAFRQKDDLAIQVAFAASAQANETTIPRNHAIEIPCNDVTALDFKNLTIHYGDRIFAFHDGIALNYDMPDVSGTPDWKAEIIRDIVVQPTSRIFVRFLLVEDEHETGSGWHDWLLGYRCLNGKLQEIFRRDGMSLSIDKLDSSGITVSLNTVPGKPVRKHWSYVWHREKSKYVLSSIRSTIMGR